MDNLRLLRLGLWILSAGAMGVPALVLYVKSDDAWHREKSLQVGLNHGICVLLDSSKHSTDHTQILRANHIEDSLIDHPSYRSPCYLTVWRLGRMVRWIQCVQWQLLFCGQRHKDSSMPNVRRTKVGLICSIMSSASRALRHVEVAIGCQYALLHRFSSKLCDISKGRAGKCTYCTCTEAALDTARVADSSIAPSLYRLPIVEKVMLPDDPIRNLVATCPPSP